MTFSTSFSVVFHSAVTYSLKLTICEFNLLIIQGCCLNDVGDVIILILFHDFFTIQYLYSFCYKTLVSAVSILNKLTRILRPARNSTGC